MIMTTPDGSLERLQPAIISHKTNVFGLFWVNDFLDRRFFSCCLLGSSFLGDCRFLRSSLCGSFFFSHSLLCFNFKNRFLNLWNNGDTGCMPILWEEYDKLSRFDCHISLRFCLAIFRDILLSVVFVVR